MVIFAVLTVKNSEKQSNSKDDHRCTNRHMSTQSPPNTQSSLLKRALYGGITVTHSSLSAKKWSNDWVGLVFCEANTFVCSYKKLVSKWDKRTLPPKPRHRSKTICKKNLHVLPDLPTLPQSYLKVETLASGFACEQRYDSWSQETCLPITRRLKPRDPINICLHMLPVCDSQTDGQTDRQNVFRVEHRTMSMWLLPSLLHNVPPQRPHTCSLFLGLQCDITTGACQANKGLISTLVLPRYYRSTVGYICC